MSYINLQQSPQPGVHRLMFRGDALEITLETDHNQTKNAKALLHTNVGFASLRRKEIIAQVEEGAPIIAADWHDIPMEMIRPGIYAIRLALNEVGHFEAKCCIILENSEEPIFVDGDQIHINVEPDDYCCANSVYCAFPRQFGVNKAKKTSIQTHTQSFVLEMLDHEKYTVIPPSGTFRDLIKELDFIIGTLRCQNIQLLPINPTPTTYARMGRYGSPYAALDFTAIDPALAEFDKSATPVDQFIELVDAIHYRNARLFLDIAINHTGWASKIHEMHPEWLVRNPDGSIHSPGAWGTVWEDLTELDHNKVELWRYLADVFLTWCQRGVDGFRCDAGYMIPYNAWLYIIARVRESYPDTLFLLEGLGGDPAITLKLLNQANMNWAYSELFQNFSRQAIEGYISYSNRVSRTDGTLIHFAETHDNLRLAATSPTWSKMRTALAALTSPNGAFAFTNGVEWFATEKIDVHSASALNWGAEENQVAYIRRLNIIIESHSAFHPESDLRFIDSQTQDAVLFLRTDRDNKNPLLCCININCQHPVMVTWRKSNVHFSTEKWYDLISGDEVIPSNSQGATVSLTLKQGEVLCLTDTPEMLKEIITLDHITACVKCTTIERAVRQTLSAVLLDMWCWHTKSNTLPFDYNIDSEAEKLYDDVPEYLSGLFSKDELPRVTYWRWPSDQNRQVMIPPDHLLVISAPMPFRVALCTPDGKIWRQYDAFPSSNEVYFAIFTPVETPDVHMPFILRMFTTQHEHSQRLEAPLLYLANHLHACPLQFSNEKLRQNSNTVLLTNGKGAMCRPCVAWGEVKDRYNALLAANLNPNYPEDRHIMFTRLRIKVIYQARTEVIRLDLTRHFTINEFNEPIWEFLVPVGKGKLMRLQMRISMIQGKNECRIYIRRPPPLEGNESFDFTKNAVKIFLYPDLEDRNFHQETKAYAGPEANWPSLISTSNNDSILNFSPTLDRHLRLGINRGKFIRQQRWFYNLWHATEASRGLESTSDLWSPGYFETELDPHSEIVVTAQILINRPQMDAPLEFTPIIPPNTDPTSYQPWSHHPASHIKEILLHDMRAFVVDRDEWKTVIAGYPWFLDWGRDTLICVRGLISADFRQEVRAILLQFAKFADRGTLPNIIHGSNVSNRDTSDAPLWLFVSLNDYINETHDEAILDVKLQGEKTLKTILLEIAQGYLAGTPNGIKVDQASNLVYSPSHFTWMDTNYPAGTPRCGYPIEIQALWFSAQRFLFKITQDSTWEKLATQTQKSVIDLFTLPNGSLSDCLNAERMDIEAKDAIRTDHNRPNQLFTITLGLITDPLQARAILRMSAKLLIPGAIRSLHSEVVKIPIPVYYNGHPLNDMFNPYWGHYEGPEDTRRKPAYHNGTAWTWIFPSYAEALMMTYGKSALPTASAILSSITEILDVGSVGHVPEVIDGDYPHAQRGCDAQAWGATEYYRVINKISKYKDASYPF